LLKKGENIKVLAISAQKAHQDGIGFYSGNEHVWLRDSIPSKYIDFNFDP